MDKGEEQPFLSTERSRQPRRSSFRWSSLLAAAICFIIGYHAIRYVVSDARHRWPGPRCGPRQEWASRTDVEKLSPDKGLIVRHTSAGAHRPFSGHVNVIGADDEDVTLTVDWRATDPLIINSANITIDGNKIGIHTPDLSAYPRDCAELDVTLALPSSIRNIILHFIAHSIHLDETLKIKDGLNVDVTTSAGSIRSDATSMRVESIVFRTSAGSIKGKYLLVSYLKLLTQAGSIGVDVAVDTSVTASHARLITESRTGSVSVDLLAPLKHRNQIKATHRTTTGSVRATYPEEWEGVVEASTTAGSLTVKGEGLEIVESRGRWGVDRFEKGIKGSHPDGKSESECASSAGSVSFVLQ